MKMQNVEDIYPLSPLQRGLLFHTLYAPGSGVYFEQFTRTIRGNFNVLAFKQAIELLVENNPILRTAFIWEGLDEPLQVVYKKVKLPWDEHDWRGLSSQEQETALESFLQSDRAEGFKLSKAPLMRFILIRSAEETYHLIWSHHHALLDGWSMPLLIKELFTIYRSLCQGEEPAIERRRPYRDYIEWLQNQDLSKAEQFWRQALRGFDTASRLPLDEAHGHRSEESRAYTSREIELTEGSTAVLKSFARQHRLTLSTVLQGAWAILMSRYSGEKDVVFGAVSSGRTTELEGAESMIGLFVNTLPTRVKISNDEPLISLLSALQEFQGQVRKYEYSPLVEVQSWSDVPAGQPLFESIFAFENYPVEEAGGVGDIDLIDMIVFEKTNYALTIQAVADPNLLIKVLYDRERFSDNSIKRLLSHYSTLLESIGEEPQQRICDLEMLPPIERTLLLSLFNRHLPSFPHHLCLHHLFQQQARLSPDSIAASFGHLQLSYFQLNRRANLLSHFLLSRGVALESKVGICLDRGIDLLVAMLAVLKAGAAYVPLDPDYPQDRLSYMVEDSQLLLLITDSHLLHKFTPSPAGVVLLDCESAVIDSHSPLDPSGRDTGREPGLHNLYLRLYGQSKRGDGDSPQRRQANACDKALVRLLGRRHLDDVPFIQL